jgi:DNA-binding SARP family transcriptional activator
MSAPAAAASEVEIRLLGPLSIVVDGREVELRGAKQRALLAVLALSPNMIVSRDRLIEAVWGDSPPGAVQGSLNVAVSKVRRVVGEKMLSTRSSGYVLQIPVDRVDAGRFERLVAEGRSALATGDNEHASQILRDALALWRGAALADFAFESFA